MLLLVEQGLLVLLEYQERRQFSWYPNISIHFLINHLENRNEFARCLLFQKKLMAYTQLCVVSSSLSPLALNLTKLHKFMSKLNILNVQNYSFTFLSIPYGNSDQCTFPWLQLQWALFNSFTNRVWPVLLLRSIFIDHHIAHTCK